MTRKTTVLPSGLADLGDRARELGFVRGALIEVIPTSAGSLLVVLDHSPPTVDASWRPLTGGAAHKRRGLSEQGSASPRQLAMRQSINKRATMGDEP